MIQATTRFVPKFGLEGIAFSEPQPATRFYIADEAYAAFVTELYEDANTAVDFARTTGHVLSGEVADMLDVGDCPHQRQVIAGGRLGNLIACGMLSVVRREPRELRATTDALVDASTKFTLEHENPIVARMVTSGMTAHFKNVVHSQRFGKQKTKPLEVLYAEHALKMLKPALLKTQVTAAPVLR